MIWSLLRHEVYSIIPLLLVYFLFLTLLPSFFNHYSHSLSSQPHYKSLCLSCCNCNHLCQQLYIMLYELYPHIIPTHFLCHTQALQQKVQQSIAAKWYNNNTQAITTCLISRARDCTAPRESRCACVVATAL